jgi:uncharacterized protein YjiS (DUF1127 family)
MTSIDHDTLPLGIEAMPHRAGLVQRISAIFASLRKRRSRKRAIQQISALDEHLLRDIGLNPQDFRDAFENRRSSLLFVPFRTPDER